MEKRQTNIISLVLCNELIGVSFTTTEGTFKVLQLIEYDSMTHQFILEVQDTNTLDVSVREFSDKLRYECELPKKASPNNKRLNPKTP